MSAAPLHLTRLPLYQLITELSIPRKYAPVPQVDTDAMTDEEFYAWVDNELDCELTLDEIQSDDAGQRCRGEI
jgi:hypothetical protein